MKGIHEVELFTLLFSLSIPKVSKIPIQPKKKAMTPVKKFQALNCILLWTFLVYRKLCM